MKRGFFSFVQSLLVGSLMLLAPFAYADRNILLEYGVATTVDVCLPDYGSPVDWEDAAAFATGDVTVMKDEGAPANIGTLPTDEGDCYSFPLTAAELQAARIVVNIEDQTNPKVWADTAVYIETYGNASAEHEDMGATQPWNAAWDAEVESEVTDALAALNDVSAADVNAQVDAAIETYHLDHLLAADYDPASAPGVSTALLNELVENDGGVSRFSANTLEAILNLNIDGTIDLQCAIGLTFAYSAGKWTRSGDVVTYRNPADSANRLVGTISATSFDTITRTCP